MNTRIIVCNIGWMKNYQGLSKELDSISSSAKFIDEKKWGYEIFNYLSIESLVYGFVQPSGQKSYLERQIRLEQIDSSIGKDDEYIENVLVIWVAPHPKGGTYVVGWYENARVYRHYQKTALINRNFNGEFLGYFVRADDCNVICLPESDRLIEQLKVQRASTAKNHKGGLGHSCVWFAHIDDSRPYNNIFRQNIINFITNYKQNNSEYFKKTFHHEVNTSLKDNSGRKNRLKNAVTKPKRIEVISTQFKRNPDVVAEVLVKANGICENCNKEAPFRRKNGELYLEVHHKIRLADGGEDTIKNAMALCPNCHRYLHYGV